MKFYLIAVAILGSQMVGCATITHDSSQTIKVSTVDKDSQVVSDARCTLKNERGQWEITSNNSTSVHRSADNLSVNCKKQGYPDGNGTLVSRTNGGMFGNILIGGGIGAIIDHSKGTAYTYPEWVRIIMGADLSFDRRDESDGKVVTGK